MVGLSRQEIMKVVNRYIGVSGGYLADFTYRTHAEFYPEYCNIDIDPNRLEGTTRESFIQILSGACPSQQAKILRGVLERFPVGKDDAPSTRTQDLHDSFLGVIECLEGTASVSSPTPKLQSAVVKRAIGDAEVLIKTQGATSGVDRIHTALHGYLIAVCQDAGLIHPSDASLTTLFKLLRSAHPALRPTGARSHDITKVLRAFAAIMDALNPVRNKASVAHPNEDLLEAPEAMLVINAARTTLQYLDECLSMRSSSSG